jgi:UDP-N-acetylglucosamine:LPS N-acetylglucosamine transferase
LSRAGASTLGEYPLFGLPAILVPYPYAWRYQRVNAQYMVQHGAAIILDDSNLNDQLLPVVRELLIDRERMDRMTNAMKSLAHPQAAEEIGSLLMNLASSVREARQ